MDRLETAKKIARERFGEGVEVEMLSGMPRKADRLRQYGSSWKSEVAALWMFRCILKSNTGEAEKEFYLNLRWKRGRSGPEAEFVGE